MRRFLPRSLLGQMILLMGTALLIAQLVNFSFLLSGQQKLSLAQSEGPAIRRFVQAASQVAAANDLGQRDAMLRRGRRFRSIALGDISLVAELELARDSGLERRLSDALREAGVPVREIQAAKGVEPERFPALAERRRERGRGRWQLVVLTAQLPDGSWLNGRLPTRRADPWLVGRLVLSTIALYVLVLGAMLWIAARITKPLRDLTRATESFEGRRAVPPVEPRGPSDLRQAITAFNAMNQRVVNLIDEKDRMLGAIGHDLRTPLASIRIRAESVEPDEERQAIVRTVREMSDTLEDILVLARTGREREPARLMDLSALVDAVVEDFNTLGAEVTFEESPRLPGRVQPNLVRRATRNLVDNALKYGGCARVRVVDDGKSAIVEVDDDGPGIPRERIEAVLRPFERLESSRSRETGGAGLGLAIAQAVAEAHGGRLSLENRPGGGLRASLILPSRPSCT